MKITQARFTRRYNVGQYEHEEYELSSAVEDGDKAGDVLKKLKEEVASAYSAEVKRQAPPEEGRRKVSKKSSKEENTNSSDDF